MESEVLERHRIGGKHLVMAMLKTGLAYILLKEGL